MSNGIFDILTKVEKSGILMKRSDQSNKWQNKFCLLKDNFLMWYKEDEFAKMQKTKYFNNKPQGVVFLSDCTIREIHEQNQHHCFAIENPAFQKSLIFAAENNYDRDIWIEQLNFNSNINLQTLLETKRFVKELMETTSTVKYARVKQDFNNAKDENETLTKLNEQLEKANDDKEKCIQDLQGEFCKMKDELEDAYVMLNNLEKSKQVLELKNQDLELDLKNLENERIKTSQLLNGGFDKKVEIESLQMKLKEICTTKERIELDRERVRKKLLERENMASNLAEENQRMINHAHELNNFINKLKCQNLDVEQKLKIEKAARLEAEKRLKEAEISLGRLHSNIVEGGTKYTVEEKSEMTNDVTTLKSYFENMIQNRNRPVSNDKEDISIKSPRTLPRAETCKIVITDHDENGDDFNLKDIALPFFTRSKSCNPEDTIKVRNQSALLREEHRKRLSQIHWDD